MRTTLVILTIALLFHACKPSEAVLISKDGNYLKGTPPGTVQIDANLYLDKSEVSNIGWREYMFWLEQIFGKQSNQYIESLPDTSIWVQLDSSHKSLMEYYFKHPAYSEYPVIGLTHTQAKQYTNWRADRVFELILVRNGILSINPSQDSTNYFTRESFYSNEKYSNYHDIPYPDYKLIPADKWSYIVDKSDSINRSNLRSCKQRSLSYKVGTEDVYCTELIIDKELVITSIENMENGITSIDPINPARCKYCRDPVVFNLYGNVREMTDNDTITLGGGWVDSIKTRTVTLNFPEQTPNCFTGFRNICEWKYNKKNNNN